MNQININGFILQLHFKPQKTPRGRLMRLSGIAKDLNYAEKWVDGILKNYWVYTFIFLDGEKELINFVFDYLGNYVCRIK